jgi:lysozyme family protein
MAAQTKPKRLSALDKARIAFTHDRLQRALEVAVFARRVGRISKKTLAIIAELKRDHERALEGKHVSAFDAFGGRGWWAEKQKQKEQAA